MQTKPLIFFSIIILLLASFTCFVPKAHATYLFSDGFESGDFTGWYNHAGNATVTTESAHSGNYGCELGSSQQSHLAEIFTPNKDYLYFRVYWEVRNGTPLNGQANNIFNFGTGSQTILWVWAIYDTGSLKWGLGWWNGASQQVSENATPTITLNTWYCVEGYLKCDSTVGQAELWINGVLVVDSGANQNTSSKGTIYEVQPWTDTDTPSHYDWFDDAVADLNYIGPLVAAQNLVFTLASDTNIYASVIMAQERYYLATALINSFSYLNKTMNLSFLFGQIVNTFSSVTMTKSIWINVFLLVGEADGYASTIYAPILATTSSGAFALAGLALIIGLAAMGLVFIRRKRT